MESSPSDHDVLTNARAWIQQYPGTEPQAFFCANSRLLDSSRRDLSTGKLACVATDYNRSLRPGDGHGWPLEMAQHSAQEGC
jgi:hypothetical protein